MRGLTAEDSGWDQVIPPLHGSALWGCSPAARARALAGRMLQSRRHERRALRTMRGARAISTARLSTSPCLHLRRPIDLLVVYEGPLPRELISGAASRQMPSAVIRAGRS